MVKLQNCLRFISAPGKSSYIRGCTEIPKSLCMAHPGIQWMRTTYGYFLPGTGFQQCQKLVLQKSPTEESRLFCRMWRGNTREGFLGTREICYSDRRLTLGLINGNQAFWRIPSSLVFPFPCSLGRNQRFESCNTIHQYHLFILC